MTRALSVYCTRVTRRYSLSAAPLEYIAVIGAPTKTRTWNSAFVALRDVQFHHRDVRSWNRESHSDFCRTGTASLLLDDSSVLHGGGDGLRSREALRARQCSSPLAPPN
jgi:hypothetical protein